jgi:hypothetical protein
MFCMDCILIPLIAMSERNACFNAVLNENCFVNRNFNTEFFYVMFL